MTAIPKIFLCVTLFAISFNSLSQNVIIVEFYNSKFATNLDKKLAKKNSTSIGKLPDVLKKEMLAKITSNTFDVNYLKTNEEDTITKFLWANAKYELKTLNKRRKYTSISHGDYLQKIISSYNYTYNTDFIVFLNKYELEHKFENFGSGSQSTLYHIISYDIYNKNFTHIAGKEISIPTILTLKFSKMNKTFNKIGKAFAESIETSVK